MNQFLVTELQSQLIFRAKINQVQGPTEVDPSHPNWEFAQMIAYVLIIFKRCREK